MAPSQLTRTQNVLYAGKVKVNVQFTLQQTMQGQRWSAGVALLSP